MLVLTTTVNGRIFCKIPKCDTEQVIEIVYVRKKPNSIRLGFNCHKSINIVRDDAIAQTPKTQEPQDAIANAE